MNMKKRLLRLSFLIAFLAIFGLGTNAWATTVYSQATGADWVTATDWNTAADGTGTDQVPAAGDTVVIQSDHDILLTADVASTAAPTKMIIKDQGQFATGNFSFYLNGDLEISSTTASAFDASAITLGSSKLLTIKGDITITSPVAAAVFLMPAADAGAPATLSGAFTVNSPATVTYHTNTDLTLDGSTSITLPSPTGGAIALYSLTVNKTGGATAGLSAALTMDAAGTTTITNGTLYTNGFNFTTQNGAGSGLVIASGATFDGSGYGTNTFADDITNNGTLKGNGATNAFNTAIFPAGGTGTYYLKNATVTFGAGVTVGVGGTSTIYAEGSDVTVTAAVTWANITLNTDENTDIDLGTASADAIGDISQVGNLTIAGNEALSADLIAYGDVTIAGGTTTLSTFDLTVYGAFDANGGTVVATGAGDKLVFFGVVTDWGTLTADANTDIEFKGSGAIANIDVADLGEITLDRSGGSLTFAAGAATTVEKLTIYSGTVTLETGQTFTNNGATTIAKNGTLVTNAATSVTFTGQLSGTGTITASGNDNLIFTVAPAFTGNLATGNSTILTYSVGGPLPASVADLEELIVTTGTVTFNSDVTIASSIDAAMLVANASVYDVNGYTLTSTAGIAAAAIGGITLENNSTLIVQTAADFTGIAARLVTDETSNLVFDVGAAITAFPNIGNCNNLTLSSAGTDLTTTGALEVYGDLTIGAGCTFDSDDDALTVYGDISNTGTLTIDGGTGIITTYGQMSGTGTFTISATLTELVVAGNGEQFDMPDDITGLLNLTLTRPEGMQINADLTMGAAGTNGLITLTSGDLDLNGFNITLAYTGGATAQLTESVGSTIVNTGTSGAYVTTATTAIANINASGIGISGLATATNATVRMYPEDVAISGVGNSISRIYMVTTTGADETVMNIAYDDSELNGNRPAALTVYQDDAITFDSPATDLSGSLTIANNARSTGITGGAIQTATTKYYTLVSGTAASGVTNTFNNTDADDDWNNANNWSNGTVPTINDDVIIPTGFAVTASANIEANSITINGTGSLDVNSFMMDVAEDVTINSSSSTALLTDANASIFIDGDLTNTSTGTIDLNAGAAFLYIGGVFTNSSSGSIVTDANTRITLNGATNTVLPDDIATVHSLYVSKSTGYTVTTSGDLLVAGASTLSVLSGELIIPSSYDLTVTGTTNVASGAKLTATGSGTRTFNGSVSVNGTGVIDLSGSGTRVLGNGAGDIISISPSTAGSSLDLSYTTTTFTGSLVFGAAGTLNLEGASIDFDGVSPINFATGTTNFNSNTALEISGAAPMLNFPDAGDLLSLDMNTNATTLTLAGDLDIAGDVTLAAGNFDIGAYTLTIDGALDASGGGTLAHTTSSKLILNGDVAAQANYPTLVPTVAGSLSLTVGGSGTLGDLPTSYTNLNAVVMNRTGADLNFTAGALVNSLNVTSGTVSAFTTGDFTVTTTTAVGSAGTLDLTASGADRLRYFTTGLSGTGTIIAEGTNASQLCRVYIASGCTYSFTGTLTTNAYTNLEIYANQTNDLNIPASVTALNKLFVSRSNDAYKVILNNDLTLNGEMTEAEFVQGYLTVGNNTLTFADTYDANLSAAGTFTLNAQNSTLVFNSKADFTTTAVDELIADETTNIEFGGGANAITAFPAITDLKNLTINTTGARTLTLTTGLELAGNLEIDGNGTNTNAVLEIGDNDITVNGNVSNQGTFNIDGTGTITLNGLLSGDGSYVTDNSTVLSIEGTSSQLKLPAGITVLGRLLLERENGVKIYSNLVVGDGVASNDDIDIITGDLDLNGYVITLAATDAQVDEAAGYTLINTGASSDSKGYITTLSTTAANIVTNNIGITALTGPTAAVVKRYPMTVNIDGVGLATKRIFYIDNTAADISAITFQYDETELYSNAASLELYYSTANNFATNTNLSDVSNVTTDVTEDDPITGQGTVALTGAGVAGLTAGTARYYALAAVPGTGGVTYTYSGAEGGYWATSTNWTPNGVPTSIDQVVIGPYTVVLNGNGSTYECATLNLEHANATLKAYNNSPTGDVVNLKVLGDIDVASGAEILGVNGTGRINLIIGDGTTAGVSSTITVNNDYTTTSGVWVNDLTVNAAELSLASGNIRISGDVTLLANSNVTLDPVEFWGGYDATQSITSPISANLSLGEVTLDNEANLTTTSNMTVTNSFIVKNDASFIANNGLISFTDGSNTVDPWLVEPDGTLKFYNVEFNHTSDFTPLGIAYIKGDFSQLNTGGFVPTSGTVIFENASQKEIINTSTAGAADLEFYNLEIAENSSVVTSNDWNINGDIDVKTNASLVAENGEIALQGTGYEIMNASNLTLFFNDVTISGTYSTEDSWKVGGDFTVSGTLLATDGTITFENVQEKTIENTGSLTFFKLSVADGSQVTTGSSNNDFTVKNNVDNKTGAGVEVLGSGELTLDPNSTVTFEAGIGLTSGYPKTISKSTDGVLEFGNITIAATPNNEVETASDFEITGTGGNDFYNSGAGATFTATDGTITFSGNEPVISSVSPAVTQFNNIETINTASLSLSDNHEILVAGDFTVNDQSTFEPVGNDSKVIFNGSSDQTIGGNTTELDPVKFADIQIDKANDSELILAIDVKMGESNGHELVLTDGILNLGSQTFTSGASTISRVDGAIDGATGTYVIAENHQNPKLEDIYFTVNDTPTLYNLQVDVAHTTAKDLTVNGELYLYSADLTIGSGSGSSSPMILTLNGDLTRNSGVIEGDISNSRLVLSGTGSVEDGLSNDYFGGTATTVQLEVARQETLGGDLNIGDGTNGYLRINTGINELDLDDNTLTFETGAELVVLSGGINAGTNSEVVFNTTITTIPATMFINNEINDVTFAADMTLGGDLTINGTISGLYNITTNDNILTFGPNVSLPAYSSTKHIIGNLRRTVDDNATTFYLGNGSEYNPVTLEYSTSGNEQLVTVSISEMNPTLNKGGNPDNAVQLLYNVSTEGTTPNDSLKATFAWASAFNGTVSPSLTDATFLARWNDTEWYDYRNDLESYTASSNTLTTNVYPIEAEVLDGEWAIFSADANTDSDKDDAIAVNNNRIVITSITPSVPIKNNAAKITLELQNQYGQQITSDETFAFTLSETGIFDGAFNSGSSYSGVIPANTSSYTVSGLTFTGSGAENQLVVDTTGGSDNWTPTTSNVFPILGDLPATQSSSIVFSNVEATSFTVTWTSGTDDDIVIIKADSLLTEDEYPTNGTTYYANTIYGAGSSIGDAVVAFTGSGTTVDVTGLSPNTTYYVYVFNYTSDAPGNERYRTSATSGNPNLQETDGSYDDDDTFGSNNTRATSKTIGTNTPVYGTLKSSTDEDWFNFTVTSSSPNIRGTLELSGGLGNYNIELYNSDNRRIRRGIRISNNDEAQVINDLPAGTYTVRIYGVDGAYSSTTPYVLKVKTSSSEIFSVTE